MCSNSQNLLLKKPRKAKITFLRTIEDALLYLHFTPTFMIKLWWVPCLMLISCLDSKETKLQRFLIQSNDMVKKQNIEQAERFLLEALKIDSCFADAWNNLGTIYFDQRKYDEAIHYYDNAVQCDPGFFDGYFNRANAAFELNEHYRALNSGRPLHWIRKTVKY
jgi:tetratricopeptide (TPR) repeat protein